MSESAKSKSNKKNPVGRPKDEFDWKLLDNLVKNESTEWFCAEIMLTSKGEELSHKSIQAMVKKIQREIEEKYQCNFVQYREQKKEYRRGQLRQKQWEAVNNGVPSLLIWMGKQYLDQKDRALNEVTGANGAPIEHNLSDITDEQLDAKIQEFLSAKNSKQ